MSKDWLITILALYLKESLSALERICWDSNERQSKWGKK